MVSHTKKKPDSRTVYMYASVNWYYKSPLNFYNDDKDMLKPTKPPRKPVKSKYQSQEDCYEEVKKWEANKPPKLKTESGGHHMTQAYYTKNLLPHYITMVQASWLADTLDEVHWLLQEDGDPSHGTKSTNNVAEDLCQANWIPVIIHPIVAQSRHPDMLLNDGL